MRANCRQFLACSTAKLFDHDTMGTVPAYASEILNITATKNSGGLEENDLLLCL